MKIHSHQTGTPSEKELEELHEQRKNRFRILALFVV